MSSSSGSWGGDRRRYAALKFIIFTFAGSAVMLLGFLALYFGVSTSPSTSPASWGGSPTGLQYLPLLAVFVGFAVELPVFPFHGWQPDAYEQAPAPVNALLSGILPKFAGYAVIRIALGLFPQAAYQYAWAFIIVGIFSMFYGAVVALVQSDLKRMFAYTSVGHMSFVLFGAFATVFRGTPSASRAPSCSCSLTPSTVGAPLHRLGVRREAVRDKEYPVPRGPWGARPLTAALLAASSSAEMGIPPFASFLAELMVISGGISAYASTAITVLVPVIVGGYFLWMLKRVIIDPPPPGTDAGEGSQGRLEVDATVVALY